MSLNAAFRTSLRTAMRFGLNPSDSVAGYVGTVDATNGWALPADATELASLLSAAGVSATGVAIYNFGAATASPVTDDIGAKDLTGSGTLTYEEAVTGMSALSVKNTSGAAGKLINAADFDDVSTTAYTVVLVAEVAATAFQATIMRFGDLYDDDACVEQVAGPTLSCGEGDGTRTAGASDPSGVRIIMLSLGATILVATDQEKITVGTRACNGDELLFGGDNVQTNLPGNTKFVHAYVLDATLNFTQMKDLIETTIDDTVAWSP